MGSASFQLVTAFASSLALQEALLSALVGVEEKVLMQPCLFEPESESEVLRKTIQDINPLFAEQHKLNHCRVNRWLWHIFSLALCSHGTPDCVEFPLDCCKIGGLSQMSCFATQHQREGGKGNLFKSALFK